MDMTKIEKRIDAVTKKDVADGLVACAGVQVICEDKVCFHGNYGWADADHTVPLTDKHLFRMASMTKPVTAVCVMQQVEAGKLALDEAVERYLPVFRDMQVAELDANGSLTGTHPAARPFTIRDLLTHSSGLGSGNFGLFCQNPNPTGNDTLADKIDDWGAALLEFDPGTRTSYSANVASDVLAHLVELAADMPYEAYAKQYLFAPLGMTDTAFTPTEDQWSRMVQMHATIDGKAQPVEMGRHIYTNFPITYHTGGAGLMSSLQDYTRFAHMLLHDGTLDGAQLLLPETVQKMRTRQLPPLLPGTDATFSWGLSMRVALADNGSQAPLPAGAYGWSGAYGTHFWCDPKNKLCAVYVSNMTTAGGSGALTARHLEHAVYDA